MSPALSLIVSLVAAFAVPSVASERPAPVRSLDDWIAIDDPDLARLPIALRQLPSVERVVYEGAKRPWFLIARRLTAAGSTDEADAVAAFAADEKKMGPHGEFIPIDEEYTEIRGGQATLFESEWTQDGEASRILAAYAAGDDGALYAFWIVAPKSESERKLLSELKACMRELRRSLKPPTGDTYASLLNGHALSFALRTGRGRNTISLESVADAGDAAFFDMIVEKHKWVHADIARDFRDEARGLSLSYQIYQADTGFGPKVPFLHWVAERLQASIRRNKDEGDTPVELLHMENARTAVVTPEELARHYAQNQRAPEAGVILQTFVPRSPFARACRLRWVDPTTREPCLALLVELRTYPRSRSETVSRNSVVMLLARASGAELLDSFEADLAFTSAPLESAAPLAALPH